MQEREWYLEDFEPGVTYESPSHKITEEEAIGFAQRYDPQYFHVDPIAARDSLFGGLICGGFQTAALAWALVLQSRMFDQCPLTGIGPYVVLKSTYLVRDASPFQTVLDLDREGVRIAVGQGGIYDLHLTRTLRHAGLLARPHVRNWRLSCSLSERLDGVSGLRQPRENISKTQRRPACHRGLV